VAKIAQGLKGKGAKKEVFFAHRILVFHFFPLFLLQMVLPYNLNVKSRPPKTKMNFSSLIITNMELRFEPYVLNLIWKRGAKDPKKKKDHIIFLNKTWMLNS
jgi:hypothetical protein